MTVLQHCIMTGYVAEALISVFTYLDKIGLFPDGTVLTVAMHDVGKISPTFQKKIVEALSNQNLKEKYMKDFSLPINCIDIPHAEISQASVTNVAGKDCGKIVGAHHGGLFSIPGQDSDLKYGSYEWQKARIDFIEELKKSFGNIFLAHQSSSELIFLSGFTIVSDWISSSISIDDFFQGRSVAEKVVKDSGFNQIEFKPNLSFVDIFNFHPRKLQSKIDEIYNGPGVYIIESEMGAGKTEAAFYLAYHLLSEKKASGIYFALPTTITSRNMYNRFSSFVNSIVANEVFLPKLIYSGSAKSFYGEVSPGGSWFDYRKRQILFPFGVVI